MDREERNSEVERLFNSKKYYRLLTLLEKWLVEDPEWRGDVLWKLGWARLHHYPEHIKVAEKELKEALANDGNIGSVVHFESFVYLFDGEEASGELELYLEMKRAKWCLVEGNSKKAISHLNKAMEMDPECPAPRELLRRIH